MRKRGQRGGAEHSRNWKSKAEQLENSIQETRRTLEQDRKDLASIEDKIGSLEQDIEVLIRKHREHAANNKPARKQIQKNIGEKKKALLDEKEWRESYKDYIDSGRKRLANLEASRA